MQPIDAKQLAWTLMREHGLVGWSFAFDHARRRFGCCRIGKKQITLSRPLVLLNSIEQVRDTLLHEIAHALTPGDGHSARWKRKCIEIGANPRRCYAESEVISPPRGPARYLLRCPRCQWEVRRRRRPSRRLICRLCRGPIQLAERMQA
ncbi:MAG: SprT-like domain-containing protein [Phycisphaerae bacterium]|nr:SprT-like domain-containing protein [Phycisphaerae bacterium]